MIMLKNAGRIAVLACGLLLLAQGSPAEEKRLFYVNSYTFDYQHHPDAPEIAQSLCGTACNALSANLDSYDTPGGWRLIRIHKDKTIAIDLDNPFIKGKCFCTGDEYTARHEYPPGYTDPHSTIAPASPQ